MADVYRLAPSKSGRMIKIVEDVTVKTQIHKIAAFGEVARTTYPALIARFVNEDIAKKFLDAYNKVYLDKETDT